MEKLTTEQINAIVDKAAELASENIVDNFISLCEYYAKGTEQYPKTRGVEPYFAAISTAQMACASVVKETLKNLLCD